MRYSCLAATIVVLSGCSRPASNESMREDIVFVRTIPSTEYGTNLAWHLRALRDPESSTGWLQPSTCGEAASELLKMLPKSAVDILRAAIPAAEQAAGRADNWHLDDFLNYQGYVDELTSEAHPENFGFHWEAFDWIVNAWGVDTDPSRAERILCDPEGRLGDRDPVSIFYAFVIHAVGNSDE